MRVGCIVCAAARPESGKFAALTAADSPELMYISKLQRHEASAGHLAAMKKLGLPLPVDVSPPPDSPGIKEFPKVVKARQNFSAYRAGIDSVAVGREKQQRIQWCVAEALREKQRAFLANAECIGISQDARHSRLLVRCVAVDSRLNDYRFALGIAKDYGSGHAAIQKATEGIIHAFCVKEHGLRSTVFLESKYQNLQSHICSHVELFVADAASDEHLAARFMKGAAGTLDAGQAPLFKNLRFVLRDPTHAMRRRGGS